MSIRPVKAIHPAYRDDIADLKTVRPVPSPEIELIDPFLFLNHHGPQVYRPSNHGLPFGPHPHRGFQTVTFILAGDIAHKDSGGHESVIKAGGVQWMNAGRGLVHEEVSSDDFKQNGGSLEILQLWVNLPAKFKMSDPFYKGLQKDEIPVVAKDNKRTFIQVISGDFEGAKGPFQPLVDVSLFTVEMKDDSHLILDIARERNIFFYVIRGALLVNEKQISEMHLVEFENQGSLIELRSSEGALVLLGHAKPFGEPIAYGGPFVMNTKEEIIQAIRDYQAGLFE
jgi:redox-sensitive bicupin YhaK (pirin superfamily)